MESNQAEAEQIIVAKDVAVESIMPIVENIKHQSENMTDLNTENFDYVVFGSGLTENILGWYYLILQKALCIYLTICIVHYQ